MDNPFVVDRPVAGEEICGRDPVLERLVAAARAGQPAAAAGSRGAGVTSVARELARRLAAGGREVLLVDAAGRTSAGAIAADGLAALDGGRGAADRRGAHPDDGAAEAERDAGGVEALVGRLAGGDGDGGAHLVLDGVGRGGQPVEGLDGLAGAARGAGAGVTALWQGTPPDEGGPLVPPEGGGAPVRMGPIPPAAWMPHALEGFLRTDRWIANEHVRAAVEATGGRPLHTQLLLHLIWEEAGAGGRVDGEAMKRASHRLLARAGVRFRLLLDPLTDNQRRLLEALARAEGPVRPYASDFVRRHGFASPSSVQRALSALREAGLVEEGPGGDPRPADPVLGRWLARPRAERLGGQGNSKAIK